MGLKNKRGRWVGSDILWATEMATCSLVYAWDPDPQAADLYWSPHHCFLRLLKYTLFPVLSKVQIAKHGRS